MGAVASRVNTETEIVTCISKSQVFFTIRYRRNAFKGLRNGLMVFVKGREARATTGLASQWIGIWLTDSTSTSSPTSFMSCDRESVCVCVKVGSELGDTVYVASRSPLTCNVHPIKISEHRQGRRCSLTNLVDISNIARAAIRSHFACDAAETDVISLYQVPRNTQPGEFRLFEGQAMRLTNEGQGGRQQQCQHHQPRNGDPVGRRGLFRQQEVQTDRPTHPPIQSNSPKPNSS